MADYEVRHFHGWYRHVSLAQLAAAVLAVQAADQQRGDRREEADEAHTGGGLTPPAPSASRASSRSR